GGLDVGLEEAGEGDGSAGGGEGGRAVAGVVGAGLAGDPDAHGGAAGVGHLGGDGALPDQLVEAVLLGVEHTVQLAGGGEGLAGGADGLVRLLRVLDLARVLPRRGRDVVAAVQLRGLRTGGGDAGLRQGRRVSTYVGDVAVLVQPLREAHR